MSFRRSADHQVSWSRFVGLYQSRLSSLGIPDIAFRTERAWNYFIEHLYDHEYPELLNLDDWSPDDLRPLLPVFEEIRRDGFYTGDCGGVLSSLRFRFVDPQANEKEAALVEARSIVANAYSSVSELMMASQTICESDDATLEDLIDCAALSFRSAAWRPATILHERLGLSIDKDSEGFIVIDIPALRDALRDHGPGALRQASRTIWWRGTRPRT